MKQSALVILTSLLLTAALLASGCTGVQQSETTPTPTETIVPETTTAPATPAVTPSHTEDEMVAFVKDAVAFANEEGKAAALEEFSDPNGSFTRGDLYIYAYDFNGTTLAHPINPEKIGVNRLNETDFRGHLYVREVLDVAQNGSGFVYFHYVDPAQNMTVRSKLGYVEKVDETWWLGSGIYGVEEPGTS